MDNKFKNLLSTIKKSTTDFNPLKSVVEASETMGSKVIKPVSDKLISNIRKSLNPTEKEKMTEKIAMQNYFPLMKDKYQRPMQSSLSGKNIQTGETLSSNDNKGIPLSDAVKEADKIDRIMMAGTSMVGSVQDVGSAPMKKAAEFVKRDFVNQLKFQGQDDVANAISKIKINTGDSLDDVVKSIKNTVNLSDDAIKRLDYSKRTARMLFNELSDAIAGRVSIAKDLISTSNSSPELMSDSQLKESINKWNDALKMSNTESMKKTAQEMLNDLNGEFTKRMAGKKINFKAPGGGKGGGPSQYTMNTQYSQPSYGKEFANLGSAIKRAMPEKRSIKSPTVTNEFPALSSSLKSSTTPQKLGTVTTPYGGNTNYEKFHPGVDIANKEGTPVPSLLPSKGVVTEVRSGQSWTPDTPSFGNYAVIKDQYGNKWKFSHLKNSYVKVGQEVMPGMIIGEMGKTGSTYSTTGGDPSHLDLRISSAYDQYVDPFKFLNKYIKD